MGKLDRVAVLVCALSFGGCRERAQPEAHAPAPAAPKPAALTSAAKQADPRFDGEGMLKGSGRHVRWLELPVTFRERAGSTAREGSFEAYDLPFEKVRDYLEARLVPRRIEVSDKRAAFHNAKPAHTQLAMEALDVTLLEISRDPSLVRLLIDDRSPSSEPPLTVEAAKRELARARQRIE